MTHISFLSLAFLSAISVSLIMAGGARAGESSYPKGMNGGVGELRFVLKAGVGGLPYPIPNRAGKGDREAPAARPEARDARQQYARQAIRHEEFAGFVRLHKSPSTVRATATLQP